MPIGENRARCLKCLEYYTCGDCITHECPACECKRRGHLAARGIDFCCRCGAKFPLVRVERGQDGSLVALDDGQVGPPRADMVAELERLRRPCRKLESARDERDQMAADLNEIGKAIGCNHDELAGCVRGVVRERDAIRAAALALLKRMELLAPTAIWLCEQQMKDLEREAKKP